MMLVLEALGDDGDDDGDATVVVDAAGTVVAVAVVVAVLGGVGCSVVGIAVEFVYTGIDVDQNKRWCHFFLTQPTQVKIRTFSIHHQSCLTEVQEQ